MSQIPRSFLGALLAVRAPARNHQRFFRVTQRGARWCPLTPEGGPFFSLGLNHIDSSALRYSENIRIWRGQYGDHRGKWIRKSVVPTPRAWRFNPIDRTKEVVVRQPSMVRHSPSFTFAEYQWADMPYCGAFLWNRVRKQGFLDEQEHFDCTFIDAVTKANQDTERWGRTL